MTILLIFIAIIVSLILVIGMHETGHALAAKCFGMTIERISIGFGKPILTWRSKNNIEWVWARWPLGGYVKLSNPHFKPIYQRIIMLLSGALANMIIAWLAFVLVFMLGYKQIPAHIHQIKPNSIAATAGLKSGDMIIALAGQKTPAWREVGMALISHLGQKNTPITIQTKAGITHHTTLDLSLWQYKPGKNALLGGLGMTLDTKNLKKQTISGVSLIQSCQLAAYQIKHLTYFFLMILKQLFTGHLSLALLLGPISLFTAMAGSFLQGLSVFAYFIGTLSIAVAVANLLPMPGLDGGSIVYALIEKVRGKSLSIALEVLLHQLAFIAFCVFMVQLLLNDFVRFLSVS